jgi:hypothetical protein
LIDGVGVGPLASTSFLSKQHKFGCSSLNTTVINDPPLVDSFGVKLNAYETTILEGKETKFINKVRGVLQRYFDETCQINRAVVFIEVIIGAEGVWTYRPSLLLRLRHLCDEYKVYMYTSMHVHHALIRSVCSLAFLYP